MFNTVSSHASIENPETLYSEHHPLFALVAYSAASDVNKSTLIVKHPISSGVFGNGVIVNCEDIISELSAINVSSKTNSPNTTISNFLNENILCNSHQELMFYEPSHTRHPIWCRNEKEQYCFRVRIPALLYYVHKLKKELYVFALESDDRPTRSTQLYAAPFPNISKNGLVCQGSARLPSITEPSNTDEISESFLFAKKNPPQHASNAYCFDGYYY